MPKPVPAGCTESHQQIDLLADSRRLCLHSAGRPVLPDGENMAPKRQHLHSQKLLRAALVELWFQPHRSALGISTELKVGLRVSRTQRWRQRRAGLRCHVGGPGGGTAQGRSSSALGQVGMGGGQIPPQNVAQRRRAVSRWLCNPWWRCDALHCQSHKRHEMATLITPRKTPQGSWCLTLVTTFSKAAQGCSR